MEWFLRDRYSFDFRKLLNLPGRQLHLLYHLLRLSSPSDVVGSLDVILQKLRQEEGRSGDSIRIIERILDCHSDCQVSVSSVIELLNIAFHTKCDYLSLLRVSRSCVRAIYAIESDWSAIDSIENILNLIATSLPCMLAQNERTAIAHLVAEVHDGCRQIELLFSKVRELLIHKQ